LLKVLTFILKIQKTLNAIFYVNLPARLFS